VQEEAHFKQFLRVQKNYRDSSANWACIWVNQFIQQFPDWEQNREETLEKFRSDLQKRKQEWVVKKAQDAIILYFLFNDTNKAKKRVQMGKNPVWITYRAELYQRTQEYIRIKHLSIRTEKTYLSWLKRFFDFIETNFELTGKNIPSAITADHLRAFFRSILCMNVEGLTLVLRAKKRKRLPVVLNRDEIAAILNGLRQPFRLMASLIYLT